MHSYFFIKLVQSSFKNYFVNNMIWGGAKVLRGGAKVLRGGAENFRRGAKSFQRTSPQNPVLSQREYI